MKKAQKKVAVPKEKPIKIEEMLAKVIALNLTCKAMGNFKRIDKEKIKTDANKQWVDSRKQLFESDTYKKILRVQQGARLYLNSHALPSLLKDGVYMIPKVKMESCIERLQEFVKDEDALVKQFAEEYEDDVKAAKKELNGLFEPKDYFTKEQIPNLFSISWSTLSFDVPVTLEDVSPELFKMEQKKHEKNWLEAQEVWKQLLLAEYQEIVNHLVERLTPSKDGKKKVLRDSVFDNLKEFAESFSSRNVMNAAQLKAMVDEGTAKLKTINPEALRDDEKARNSVRAQFEQIKNKLDDMVTTAGGRAVSFDEAY